MVKCSVGMEAGYNMLLLILENFMIKLISPTLEQIHYRYSNSYRDIKYKWIKK